MDNNGTHTEANDLGTLIETKIPQGRTGLEETYASLDKVAAYCESNYFNAKDKLAALEETKQFALQSLASVAYQIDGLAKDLLDMLDFQCENMRHLTSQVENVSMGVDLQKEKTARRDIGQLTTNKSVPRQQKIIMPDTTEPLGRYKRTPIDFSALDGVGHGVRSTDCVSRHPLSTPTYSSHYAHFSPASINNTLSRASMRSAMSTLQQEHHYRVPQTVPVVDASRLSAMTSVSSLAALSNNSHSSSQSRYSAIDRYGTLRAQQPRCDTWSGMPPPPQPQTPSYTAYCEVRDDSLAAVDEEPLPPPPSFFDSQSDWVPQHYLEKAVALYDYEADKPDELSLRANCTVYVLRKNEDGWYEGVLDGVTGLFPGNYVQPT